MQILIWRQIFHGKQHYFVNFDEIWDQKIDEIVLFDCIAKKWHFSHRTPPESCKIKKISEKSESGCESIKKVVKRRIAYDLTPEQSVKTMPTEESLKDIVNWESASRSLIFV